MNNCWCGKELVNTPGAPKRVYCSNRCATLTRRLKRMGLSNEETRKLFVERMGGKRLDSFKTKEYWLSQDFSGYRLQDLDDLPAYWGPRSNLRVRLINQVGHVRDINFRSLYTTNNVFNRTYQHKSHLLNRKFGKLTILDIGLPEFLSVGASIDVHSRCDCGKECVKNLYYIQTGDTKSCGECLDKPKEHWFNSKYNKLSIVPEDESEYNKRLNLPEHFSPGSSKYKGIKVEVRCDCGKTSKSSLYDVVTYRYLSCGCALNENRSNASKEFYDVIRAYFPDAEYSVYGLLSHKEIDVYIPSIKLAIEYHGCYWHSEARRSEKDKLKDFEKYQALNNIGIRNIQIYSDEWRDHKDIFLDIIAKNRGKTRINPQYRYVSFAEATSFLDKFHYLAGNKHSASIYIGAYNDTEMVGCWTFQKRDVGFEWKRAAWNHKYRAWTPHSRALSFFRSGNIGPIIAFSENRLFTGDMYAKMGFKLDAELPPDYCYTNGIIRKHKFTFRVPAGIDERAEATKKNFYKLWDCGKKRWRLE